MDAFQRPIVGPAVKIIMDCAAGWQVLWDITPLTAGTEDVHKAAQNLSDVDSSLIAATFGRRYQRFDLSSFFVGWITTVLQPTPVVFAAGLWRPHQAPRASVPCIKSQTIRTGQPSPANRL
jgi:hypothetical protein